jgi:transposase
MNSLLLEAEPRQDRKRAAVHPPAGTPVVIAVDLARTTWVYACRWADAEQRRLSTPAGLPHLQALVRSYLAQGNPVTVVYEACGFGHTIAWWVAAQPQATGVVVAPSSLERAPGARVKTDRRDAGALAFKAERGLLRSIYVPTPALHQARQLARTYAQVLGDRRRAQVRLRLCFQEQGELGAPARTAGWPALARWITAQLPAQPAAVQASVAELLHQRAAAAASTERLRTQLRALGRTAPYAALVRTLSAQPGVGPFTALRVVLELGDITRFPTAGSLANYLGLTPAEASSGETVHRGHTRKCGPGAVRGWLLQCAWVAIRPGRDAALRAVFERLAPRIGRKRAIVAVARRLALRLRARWRAAIAPPPAAAP